MFEHICTNWKTSVSGLLLALMAITGVLSQQGVTGGQAGTGTVVGLIGALAVALLGLIMKDPGNWGKGGNGGKLGLLLFVLMAPMTLCAQTLATQATASAFRYHSAWSIGTEQTQSFPLAYFGAQKGNVISLGAREIIAPGTFSGYGALGNFSPDISKLIAKSTFNPDQFNISFDVMGGIATLPSNLTKPMLEGRVNFNYAFSPSVALTGAYAGGGLIGNDRFATVSAGLQYIFGAGNVPSAAMHRMQMRAAQKKLALAVAGR